jgi:hypothetical protein
MAHIRRPLLKAAASAESLHAGFHGSSWQVPAETFQRHAHEQELRFDESVVSKSRYQRTSEGASVTKEKGSRNASGKTPPDVCCSSTCSCWIQEAEPMLLSLCPEMLICSLSG